MSNSHITPVTGSGHEASPVEHTASSTSAPASSAPNYNASTPVSSVGDLKQKAPKLYNAMMQGIATTIISEMSDHQERMKELAEEGRREGEGG
jgi:hypothetical protein